MTHYPRGSKALLGMFHRFQPEDMLLWLERHGVDTHIEADGRIFPETNDSQTILDCFTKTAHQLGIKLFTSCGIKAITHNPSEGFTLTDRNEKNHHHTHVILATGYSPPGWKLAKSLGHTIIDPVPSLFPFKLEQSYLEGLQGISVTSVKGKIRWGKAVSKATHEAEGACLITHQGLSGPLIYRLSAKGAHDLHAQGYQAKITIDWLPSLTENSLRDALQTLFYKTEANKLSSNTSFEGLSKRLWIAMLEHAGIHLDAKANTVSKKSCNKLIELLKRSEFNIIGKSPSKEEFVSCGGVALNEVDTRRMESKRVPNLYLGGEILNIDGLTGGFNFQACWSAGAIIGKALLNKE